MKNGLHFDNFDNLLFQIAGSKRAILFPPEDSPHLYYSSEGVNIRRHAFNLKGGFANETVHEAMRKNVAWINVFDEAVATSHRTLRRRAERVPADAGDALSCQGMASCGHLLGRGRRNVAGHVVRFEAARRRR